MSRSRMGRLAAELGRSAATIIPREDDMKRACISLTLGALIACTGSSSGNAQSATKAKRLAEHGLAAEAKAEFIGVLQSAAGSATDKAEAL